MEFNGDSGEYEFLAEAIELSKEINGVCLEIGLRLGKGMATMIDAIAEYCPEKLAVSVDCYGSMLYHGREGKICRLDYTETMRNECLPNIYAYAQQKQVHYKFIELSDTDFFDIFKDGIIVYDHERILVNKYAMVHLDGPHNIADLHIEITWFNERMDKGSVIVLDDITPDFFDLEPVEYLLFNLGFKTHKKGLKKGIYVKSNNGNK